MRGKKKYTMPLWSKMYSSPENWAQQTAPGTTLLRTEEEEDDDDTELLLLQ